MIKGLEHFPNEGGAYLSHPSHARPGIHPFPDRLHVVTMLSNPLRWRNRYLNYWKFQHHVEQAGAILTTVEVAFGDREFEVTEATNPRDVQLRTDHELWHKENALNIGISRLPVDAKYIAVIDADLSFARTDWAQETLHLLQHYQAIQMYSHLKDVGPQGEPVSDSTATSFVHMRNEQPHVKFPVTHLAGCQCSCCDPSGYDYNKVGWGCPGGAWAYRREALDALGGLMDWVIVGSADYYMALALFGDLERALAPNYHPSYKHMARLWQERALKHLHRNVGCMPGLLLHSWHGPKAKRGYEHRPEFLVRSQFNPCADLKRDWQGLWQIEPENIVLRDGIRAHNRARHEDQQ